jgi:hypothetical protein
MSKFAQAAAAAVKDGKVNEADFEGGGEFTYEPPVEGPCVARLVSVIEIGNHPQRPYNGQDKPPAPEIIFQFELLGKKHRKEITVKDEAGSDTKKIVYPIITERMTVKAGPRAGYIKLLEALRYGRKEMTHPAMMIGEAFILTIIHGDNGKEGKEKRIYANIKDGAGIWKVGAPVRVNEEGETEPLKAPPATVEESALLWDAPDMDQWNSLYIPGSRTKKVDGKEQEVSKNWLQETVKSALNFEGSPVATLVATVEGGLPSMMDDSVEEFLDPVTPKPGSGGDAPDEGGKATSDEDDDPLADLGL